MFKNSHVIGGTGGELGQIVLTQSFLSSMTSSDVNISDKIDHTRIG